MDTPTSEGRSALSPFRQGAFTAIWTATVVANIGAWMYSAGAGWLMAMLAPDPVMVSLVQVSTSLPIVLFALPAGALADIVDRRRLLIAFESAFTLASSIFAVLVSRDEVTPATLLLFTFVIGTCGALATPAWQAIVPEIVPKSDLRSAIAANSVGINVSRAIGPALGGLLAVWSGIAAPFWVNAVSNLGVIGVLVWWRSPPRVRGHLPPERFASSIRVGIRHAWYNPHLRSTLWRALAFFLFASAYWALLPLVASIRLGGGAELYGILLGAIGAGAVAGAFALPQLNALLGPDRLVAVGSIGTAITLVLYGSATDTGSGLLASALAGCSWIAVLSSLNVSAQVALPEWVRGRGLSVFVMAFFGALALGGVVWGEIAAITGLSTAHFIAAAGLVVAIPLTWRWKLQTGLQIDQAPSMHWKPPSTTRDVEATNGPVLVTVEYLIDPINRDKFLTDVEKIGKERRRDGAYSWGVFEDTGRAGRFLETFLVSSWLEHLYQHERVTKSDRIPQDAAERFQIGGPPIVTHFIAAFPGHQEEWSAS